MATPADLPTDGRVQRSERSREAMDEAKKHLNDAREKMSSLASKTRAQAEELYGKTKEQYESLSARSKEAYSKVRERVAEVDFKEKGDQVLEYIRVNPGKAVLIALAAGFLIGYITRPRE